MKKLVALLLSAISAQMFFGQVHQPISSHATIDSLKNELKATQNDTLRLVLFTHLRYNYFFVNTNLDSALFYSKEVLRIAQKLKYKIDEAYALDLMGDAMNFKQDESTFETFFKGVKIAEEAGIQNKILPRKYLERMLYWENNFTANLAKNQWSPLFFRLEILASLYQDLGRAYGNIMVNQQQLSFYLSRSIEIHTAHQHPFQLALDYNTLAEYFLSTNQLDSCLFYAKKAYVLQTRNGADVDVPYTLGLIGTIYFKKDNYPEAINVLRESIQTNLKYEKRANLSYVGGTFRPYLMLSEYFLKIGTIDSSLYYAKKASETATLPVEAQNTYSVLAKLYKIRGNSDSALKYFELSLALNDSINNADKRRKLQSQDFDEQIHRQEIKTTRIESENRMRVYVLLGGLSILIIIVVVLYRNNRQRKKTNTLLVKQKKEIQSTLQELKSTQAQLIQSEKMASLGELTAGIAHEIQNPLNFVNNFSEVNEELLSEMNEQMANGNFGEAKALASNVIQNQEKIKQHGKRADTIVKNMLQHSRERSGTKELVDINAICDEYLRLVYHGLRAKDKTFNAKFETSLADDIGRINVVPQDICRVLLNLINNAFYAVTEKKQQLDGDYEPCVSVRTRRLSGKIEIAVKDNGNGVPERLKDKIFQPFFTTKPAGKGTGLGLSMAYDIVKAHGGEIKVETKEGEGSEFSIELPLNT